MAQAKRLGPVGVGDIPLPSELIQLSPQKLAEVYHQYSHLRTPVLREFWARHYTHSIIAETLGVSYNTVYMKHKFLKERGRI